MTVVTTAPARVLYCKAMHGDGPPNLQSGSSPSYSPLAELNCDAEPFLVVNDVGEPQQMSKNIFFACCAIDAASVMVMILDPFSTVKLTTPP